MSFVPDRGDIIWLNFNPHAGHEQSGKRPALVISPKKYNEKTNLAICCPITSKEKGYPFEVKTDSKKINGVILSDQIKSLDWKEREAEFIEKSKAEILEDVLAMIRAILFDQA
jgi:mRNA interferase MazF